jgi:phage recombination protein Bet
MELTLRGQATPQAVATKEQMDLLRRTIAAGTNDVEFALFLELCRSKRLDPFAKHIQVVKRYDQQKKDMVPTFQTGIDGFRLIAQRTGLYRGQDGPYWCGDDGAWVDVWVKPTPPVAARVGVLRADFEKPIFAVAHYAEYVQKTQDGKPNSMWAKMACNQLAKCAEALAIRKAFPEDLAGLYAPEEMRQASEPAPVIAAPAEAVVVQAEVVERPWRSKKEMVGMFDELGGRIDRAKYLATLSMYGVQDATAFTDPAVAHQCFTALLEVAGA